MNASAARPPGARCGAARLSALRDQGVYRPGKDGRGAFYGCPNYEKHKDKKFIVNADAWVAEQQAKAAKPAPVANGAPPSAAEVFGT
jgi:hypothetical protein